MSISPMNILALDPAQRCGFAHSTGPVGVWELGSGPQRLDVMETRLVKALQDWPTSVIAYESATFGSHHLHTMRRHNELAGVIELVAARYHLRCWTYNPMQWKASALGHGKLDKEGVMRMLRVLYGLEITDPDMADAVGILRAAMRGEPPPSKRKQRSTQRKLAKKDKRLF